MLKAGPPDVMGRPEGPGVPAVRAWRRGGQHSRAVALPPFLPYCLSVSSASLPPYTLSHFSPMSLPEQGGGDIKRDKQRGEGKEGKREESKEKPSRRERGKTD